MSVFSHADENTLVSALSYRRDLYQLVVLLLADEKVAAHEQFKGSNVIAALASSAGLR